MGKGRCSLNPFPEINMTPDDRLQLQDLANHLIISNLEHYNKFLTDRKGQVEPSRWKHVKSREQLNVYAERSKTSLSASDTDELSGSGLPMILCVGSLEGNMEDLMYGVMSEDMEAMRIKATYVEELKGAAILESIVEPTSENPFQTLMLKWMERDIPLSLTKLVKNRDYVYLEGTGFLTAPNGDRVGYHFLHSVGFSQTHELPNRVRGNVSIIAFWRQTTLNTIEMYGTAIIDPRSDKLRKLVIPGMANGFLFSVAYTFCGQMRKLSFMLEKANFESKQRAASNKKDACVTCSTPITVRRVIDFSKNYSTCKLCFGYVCQSCKAVRKLSFVDPDLMLRQRNVTFCTACIASVTTMSAADCARAKVLTLKRVANQLSSSMFSSTSRSNSS